jgi:hypothetical protein
MGNELTVGKLREQLNRYPFDVEITFGSSKYRQRPLVFYRFKQRGEDILQIELNELEEDVSEPVSEHECRKTVGYFLEQLSGWDDHFFISFGATIDASPLKFTEITPLVGINLDQPEKPEWKVGEFHEVK